MPLPISSSSRHNVTLEKLDSSDYYRVQVKLDRPEWWAVGYNSISDIDPVSAARLRDWCNHDVQTRLINELKTLIGVAGFKSKLEDWMDIHVSPDAYPRIKTVMERELGVVFRPHKVPPTTLPLL